MSKPPSENINIDRHVSLKTVAHDADHAAHSDTLTMDAEQTVFPSDSSTTPDEAVQRLVDVRSHPVRDVLDILLYDRTLKRNIIWATDAYREDCTYCDDKDQIKASAFSQENPVVLVPRIQKNIEEQLARTRRKAEVFTPIWICNEMNNALDEDWFGRKDVFNRPNEGHTWTDTEGRIWFPEGRTWMMYVDSRRLEITCGEAPFLVSRYDAATGRFILPPSHRIGILDRKLRIVDENAGCKEVWTKWAIRAMQSCYGYEWQGDNLLIARVNLFMTFCDFYKARWGSEPDERLLKQVALIISWNIWQMDGLKDSAPRGKPLPKEGQRTLLDSIEGEPELKMIKVPVPTRIYDWRLENSVVFNDQKKRGKMDKRKKLFDYVIGNPPYQEINDSNGRQPPVYHKFMDAAYEIGAKVELITPARFLFDAGQTPKDWNEKMLNDEHLKVLKYEPDASKVFSSTEIKGGVAVTYHDSTKSFPIIDVFVPFNELQSIRSKIQSQSNSIGFLSEIVSSQGISRFTDQFNSEHPEASLLIGKGTGNKIVSSIVEQLPDIFKEGNTADDDSIRILSKGRNGRSYYTILKQYIESNSYIDTFNVIVPESNGNGRFDLFSSPLIAPPGVTVTDTFLSIGTFSTESEAQSALKYIKTKFARALLGVKKVTQHNPKSTWEYVPLQDFTSSSDIDWSQSVPDIDRQLYRKYGLSQEEIDFIESHVQEMSRWERAPASKPPIG